MLSYMSPLLSILSRVVALPQTGRGREGERDWHFILKLRIDAMLIIYATFE